MSPAYSHFGTIANLAARVAVPVKAGLAVGLAATVLSLSSGSAVAQPQEEAVAAQGGGQKTYGLLNGLWDGVTAPINMVVDAFSNKTLASDGTGIASEPATGWYGFAYFLGLGIWGGSGTTISVRSGHHHHHSVRHYSTKGR